MLEAGGKMKLGGVMWKGVQSKREDDMKGSMKDALKLSSKP